ncbi:hypothetical protein NAEGRDRAFT_79649 [Naegleria gruberi]|uniref:V-type proton ATPase subunit G n=1 Tax=Naegleria gruberi TaxID=5762 RepID=D2VEF2_NAEGR|nr:uncharacterized protein NAEGRDRAFT_79649 [Naegleria gruberi]EFC44790.1 hypothetical protein NAEGRDRAFT_79649 [Naegleria gruberi]|eukprot:XP_002677534.1 hypothetical protein NAEGRDRAFT_79649 [Naegleria gruberi strain NEG-M]
MSSKKSASIQQLLAAEQEATEIVKEAKKQRLIKLREAKEEAEKEIAKFKASKEQYFQKFTKEQLEVGGTNNELQQKKVQIIYNIKQKTQQKRPDIVKFVVDNVINVNTDLEQEQEAFIEKKKKGIF